MAKSLAAGGRSPPEARSEWPTWIVAGVFGLFVAGCSQSVAEPKPAVAEPLAAWRVSRVESTDTAHWQSRTAHVIYPAPESRELLAACVKHVYAEMRQAVLDRQQSDRATKKVIVHVYWTELEDQQDGGSWIAHTMAERVLPAQLSDEQIEIVWRSSDAEPTRHSLERFVEVKASGWTKNEIIREPSEFEESQRRGRQAKKKLIEGFAAIDGKTFAEVRRQLAHVWLWQQGKPCAAEDIDRWSADEDGSILGDRD